MEKLKTVLDEFWTVSWNFRNAWKRHEKRSGCKKIRSNSLSTKTPMQNFMKKEKEKSQKSLNSVIFSGKSEHDISQATAAKYEYKICILRFQTYQDHY